MFGYVRIHKESLTVADYEKFRSCYCGLCKTIQKEYGTVKTLSLSYDVTFLAILLSAVCDISLNTVTKHCAVNPFKKKTVIAENEILDYCGFVNVMLTYLKLKDDINDEKSIKASLALPFLRLSKRKCRYPALYTDVKKHLDELSRLEKNRCDNPDALANEFGLLMQKLFDTPLIQNDASRRTCAYIGYNLGRFIYLLDAVNDFNDDIKNNSFNPFRYNEPDFDIVKQSLIYTLSDILNSYRLLNLTEHEAILNNILSTGMNIALNNAFNVKEKKINE